MRKPTQQQTDCITALNMHRMLKINACAGAGKTSTLTMMAEAYPEPSLYLAFNKVTAEEAAAKFPKHVTCRTTHSLAYSIFGIKLRDKLSRPKGKYVNVAGTGTEIGRYFDISSIELSEDLTLSQAYLGLLVRTCVAYFEQSADDEISNKHVPMGELKEKLKKVNGANINYVAEVVMKNARKLWKERINTNSPVLATHDTYLKLYQLSKPVLHGYNILYVDEFQDTTPCVLDIVLQQQERMKVVMVGDARQAIYGWRGAVNAMQMVDCEQKQLTKSFRYGQPVADIATKVLEGSMCISGFEKINSKVGQGVVDISKPHTRLFRTNAALLAAAISEIQRGTEVSIEIDTKDFVKLLESAVALYKGDSKQVKHDKMLPYTSWLEACAEAEFDPELSRIVKIIDSGFAKRWIEILESHVNSKNPRVTFTTAHKSKGREFSQVIIEDDFKSNYGEEGWVGLPTEEQNLLYVACTRAIDALDYNQTVVEYLSKWEYFHSLDPDDDLDMELAREVRQVEKDTFFHALA